MLGCGLRVLSLLVAAAAAGYCTTEGGEEDATVLVQGDGPVWLHFYVAPASLAIPPPAMLLSLCWIGITGARGEVDSAWVEAPVLSDWEALGASSSGRLLCALW